MNKYTTFNTINSMLDKKYKFTLPFSDEAKALICKCDSEQMHRIMFELYATRNTSEEFVKKSIANVMEETKRTIGFSSCK